MKVAYYKNENGKVIRFRSASAKALFLMQNTTMTDSEIARRCKITPQTVHRIKMTNAGLYHPKG